MSWLHALRGLIRRSAARRPSSRRRLALEVLEGRTLLSVYTVDRLTDAGEGDGLAGDLRYALTQAADGDSIQFAVQGTLNLTRALPDLTQSVSIEGPGADLLTVRRDTGGGYRIFTVAAGTTVGISGLTIANGGGSGVHGGGGISNEGTLTVSNSTFSGNGGTDVHGGGISNEGTLTVSRSTFSGNRASFDHGGGIYNSGTLTVSRSTFSRNLAPTGTGGGIYNRPSGTLTVSDSTLSDNQADAAGGIYNSGTLTVSSSTFSGNVGVDNGGAILNFGALTVSSSTLSGNGSARGGGISNQGTLAVSDSTLSGNRALSLGAGGGIYNGGTLTVSDSTLSGNSASNGGGILNVNQGTLTVRNSTLSGNTASGVQTAGGILNFGTLTVSNSTLSGNTASGPDAAGGIANFAGNFDATVLLLNSTVANNTVRSNNRTASQLFSGRIGGGTGTATIDFRNTIVSGDKEGSSPNVFAGSGGTFVSQGHNLSSDDAGGFLTDPTDLTDTDPLLGPLQDNGGPTQTMALLDGSPAIDAGDNTDAPDFDQRGDGFPRIVNDVIDIGAFEVQAEKAGPFTPPRGKPFRLGVGALLGIPPSQPVRGIPSAAKPTAAGVEAVFSKDHAVRPNAAEWRPTAGEAPSHRLSDKESQPRWPDWAEGVLWPVLS